jgi:hypothetical protein
MSHTKDGKYDAMKSSQADKAATAILVVGDA